MRIYAKIPSIYVAGIEEVKAGIALTRNCFHEQNIAQNSGITGKPRSFHMQTDETGPPGWRETKVTRQLSIHCRSRSVLGTCHGRRTKS
jgi:hypothetical protein